MKSHQISFVSLDLHSLFICTLVQTELIWGKYFQTSYQNLDNSSCNTAVNIIHRTPFHSLDYFGIFLFGSFLSKKKKDCNISKPPMGLVIKKYSIPPQKINISQSSRQDSLPWHFLDKQLKPMRWATVYARSETPPSTCCQSVQA